MKIDQDLRRMMYRVVEEIKSGRDGIRFAYNTPLTPHDLVDEILDHIIAEVGLETFRAQRFLVLYTIEFAIVLRERGCQDITVTTEEHCAVTAKLCRKLGFQYELLEDLMKPKKTFDCTLANPPFSLAGKKSGKKGRSQNLYPQFYRKATEISDRVYMIVPNTSRQTTSSFNAFIRENTNKIIPIDDDTFDINIPTWCLVRDQSDTNVDHIDWADLHEFPEQKVRWAKGKVNVTMDKHLLEDSGGDFTVFHKINGSGLHSSSTSFVPENKLLPKTGYAVIMPQQIQSAGWTDTKVIKCDGKQAATNGVNLAFLDTREEAEYLVEYMKSRHFVDQALKFCGGMNNMTLGAMKKINMDNYTFRE